MPLIRPFRSLQKRIRGRKNIHDAAKEGDAALVQDHLVAAPARVNEGCVSAPAALHFVTFSCCISAARLPLPRLTAFLHRRGRSPLHMAAFGGHEVARLLVAAGADVNMQDG